MKGKTLCFLAFRLLMSGRKLTAVSIISWIAILGMIVSSASIVILLSAFNGIEQMIEKLYSSFDQEVVVTPSHGRKMEKSKAISYQNFILKQEGVQNTSLYIQERVIVRNKKKWSNAELWAVTPAFYGMAEIKSGGHLVNGRFEGNAPSLIGVGLANRLMMESMNQEAKTIVLYYPKQNKKIKFGQSPFYQKPIRINGALEFNKEVNDNVLLLPLGLVDKYYENHVSGILVSTKSDWRNKVKQAISSKFPGEIEVTTNLEKNQLIFKTSRSEKLIVVIILLFVFVLSLFNLAASITMTFIEKKKGLLTLYGLGLSSYDLRNLFLLLGGIVVFIGVGIGVTLGTTVIAIHENLGIIRLPNSEVFFPTQFSWTQIGLISILLLFLGTLVAWLTATFLIKPGRKEPEDFIIK